MNRVYYIIATSRNRYFYKKLSMKWKWLFNTVENIKKYSTKLSIFHEMVTPIWHCEIFFTLLWLFALWYKILQHTIIIHKHYYISRVRDFLHLQYFFGVRGMKSVCILFWVRCNIYFVKIEIKYKVWLSFFDFKLFVIF